jgi:fibro-slime domain-containing protein
MTSAQTRARRRLQSLAILGLLALALLVLAYWPHKLRTGHARDEPNVESIRLTGVVRDFLEAHPDFGVVPSAGYGHYAANVDTALGPFRVPLFLGGGYRVDGQWRDGVGRPIAPNLYMSMPVTTECTTIPGITANGLVSIDNQSEVDSFDSSLGPYGGANVGNEALVSTNSVSPGMFRHRNTSDIQGTVLIGPGGDPAVVYTTHPNCILSGTIETLDDPIPMPVIAEPDGLRPSAGDLVVSNRTKTIGQSLRVDRFVIQSDGEVVIRGDVTIICERECRISGRGLRIGNNASLRLFVKEGFECRTAPCNMNTGDPSRLHIYALGDEPLRVEGNTAHLVARIFAPDATLSLHQSSQVYGTFVGESIDLDNNAWFHVDTALSGPTTAVPDTPGTPGTASSGGISSPETFQQWFRDVPGVNVSTVHSITLHRDPNGVYEYATDEFHPIDDRLLGNESDRHNRYLTYTISAGFVYEPCAGQFVEFQGDDDAWIFVHDRLVMDLGGIIPLTSQYVELDRLGLVPGQRYRLRLFHAQRQDRSAQFLLRTSIPLMTGTHQPTITDQFD